MQKYNELFQDAIALSKRLNLDNIVISLDGNKVIAEWFMYELGPKIAEKFSREAFVEFMNTPHASVKLHHHFKPIVDELLNVDTIVTTGFIKVANDANEIEEFGRLEPESIAKALENKKLPKKILTWLTLPSGEILDLAFMTIYGLLYHEDSLMGNIVAKHADQLTGGMLYAPQLVGELFYERSGFDFTIDFLQGDKED